MRYDQKTSLEAWTNLVVQGQLETHNLEVDPYLREAWLRCLHNQRYDHWPKLNYAKGVTLSSIKRKNARLIDFSLPVIEDIHEFLESENCAILLTDESGCTLSLYVNSDIEKQLKNLGIEEGVYWSESSQGNNAISSSLTLANTNESIGHEHFKQALHSIACYSAPLFDSEGNILGSIALILPVNSSNDFIQGLVYSASKEISTNLYADYCLTESNRRLNEVHVLLEGVEEGVLAWDCNGIIHYLNAKGSDLLKQNSSKVLGHKISDIITLPRQIQHAIDTKKDLSMFETTLEINHNLISVLMSLHLVRDESGNIHTSMILMHPIEHIRQLVHNQLGSQARLTFDDIVFRSNSMQTVIRQSQRAANGRGSVFIHGEEGLGKTNLAQAIHNASERSDKAFISINCQAIPRVSMVTEFLGFDSNSNRPFPSKFELASGGTLFLEHVESLTSEVQAALLHLLKTGLVNKPNHTIVPVDIRVIATSDINLEQYVDEKRFGRQLMYELQSFDILLPPLRKRIEDIPLLAERYLKFLCRNTQEHKTISNDTMDFLTKYSWPGNNRELRNVLERALSISNGSTIQTHDLPNTITQILDSDFEQNTISTLAETEKDAIIRSAARCNGSLVKMCQELGVSRTTLWRKMKYYEINSSMYK